MQSKEQPRLKDLLCKTCHLGDSLAQFPRCFSYGEQLILDRSRLINSQRKKISRSNRKKSVTARLEKKRREREERGRFSPGPRYTWSGWRKKSFLLSGRRGKERAGEHHGAYLPPPRLRCSFPVYTLTPTDASSVFHEKACLLGCLLT